MTTYRVLWDTDTGPNHAWRDHTDQAAAERHAARVDGEVIELCEGEQ